MCVIVLEQVGTEVRKLKRPTWGEEIIFKEERGKDNITICHESERQILRVEGYK